MWRECRVEEVRGRAVGCGHYIPEEAPGEVLREIEEFFGGEGMDRGWWWKNCAFRVGGIRSFAPKRRAKWLLLQKMRYSATLLRWSLCACLTQWQLGKHSVHGQGVDLRA